MMYTLMIVLFALMSLFMLTVGASIMSSKEGIGSCALFSAVSLCMSLLVGAFRFGVLEVGTDNGWFYLFMLAILFLPIYGLTLEIKKRWGDTILKALGD